MIDDPDPLLRLCANVRPPMAMEEHVERLEALYTQAVNGKSTMHGNATLPTDRRIGFGCLDQHRGLRKFRHMWDRLGVDKEGAGPLS